MNITGLIASAKTIRTLSIDAIEKAGSGHPGLPMGCAEIGSYLFGEVLIHNPSDVNWLNRDRFVLSAGHGSMLLYSLLFLSGYGLTLDDIRNFRQFKSLTPGHPEYGWTKGVETSTGPLGQGVGNAVGMAIASKINAQKFNRENYEIINNRIFVLAGDGDLMEGVSHEACSLAGHLRLNNLILIYDRNKITIEGSTDLSFTENIEMAFRSMEWHVVNINGHDFEELKKGFDEAERARKQENKPVIIIANTTIGKGSPNKQGTKLCHGAPLGKDECQCTKELLGVDECFFVDKNATEYFSSRKKTWKENYESWQELFREWSLKFPDLKSLFDKNFKREIPKANFANLPEFEKGQMEATRSSTNKILNAILNDIDFVVSGSADLASSTETFIKGREMITPDNFSKYNIQYGIREHAMGTIVNGLYLFGGMLPIAGTFLSFMTYMLPAIRMSAMMQIPVVYIFSHDSIHVGEDGPTHQPVEHISMLRMIPNLNVMRPCDPYEVRVAWEIALKNSSYPSAIVTSRQKVPTLDWNSLENYNNAKKGGYIIKKEKEDRIDLVMLSTGSEVSLTLGAAGMLENEGYSVRVVSMFSMFLFDKQEEGYRDEVIPASVEKRFAVEAAAELPWYKYIGLKGRTLTINEMGISGKGEDVVRHFGFTVENIYKKAKDLLARS